MPYFYFINNTICRSTLDVINKKHAALPVLIKYIRLFFYSHIKLTSERKGDEKNPQSEFIHAKRNHAAYQDQQSIHLVFW